MTFEEIQQRLAAKFGERIGALAPANKDPFLVVPAADVVEICRFAKEDEALAFDCLMNLSSVDWPKKNQIEVVYHLWSYRRRHSFVLKVQLDRAKPEVPSVESIWTRSSSLIAGSGAAPSNCSSSNSSIVRPSWAIGTTRSGSVAASAALGIAL